MGSDWYQIENLDELLKAIKKRAGWKKIRPAIIEQVFDRSIGTLTSFESYLGSTPSPVMKVKRFVHVSEKFDFVDKMYIRLPSSETPVEACSRMASVLEELAFGVASQLEKESDPEKKMAQLTIADMLYQAGLLCDPFQLGTYGSLAGLYLVQGKKELALGVCDKYDEAVVALSALEDSGLSSFQRAAKNESNEILSRSRANISEIRSYVASI